MKAEIKSPHTAVEKFASLLEISRRMNSKKNFDELLNIIAVDAAKLLEAERATIFLLDKDKGGELWAKIALGESSTIRFDARQGIAGAALFSGKTLVVEDAHKSPLFNPAVDAVTGYQTRNILSVPLRNIRSELIGVFQVLNKRDGKFMSEDEQFAEALAAQAAIALENAWAVAELEEHQKKLIAENQSLRKEVEERFSSKNILGTTAKISQIRALIERIAETSVSVLITGDNGTGKELSARAIHFASPQRAKPFVVVNCAAIPDSLIESELFGIEKGVATGVDRRVGRIESANGGTLFLDEIGDLSLTAQAKLLRVLQEREIEWVGGRKPIPVDFRLLAATNRDLKDEIQQKRFRQDLYFRLNVIHIHMPPLREVRSDIPLLAMHFLRKHAQDLGRNVDSFTPEALDVLSRSSWPGNVRQLENEVKRAIVLCTGSQIRMDDLSTEMGDERLAISDSEPAELGTSKQLLKDRVTILEIQMIRDAMAQTKGERRRTAKMLGLSHQGLINKLKRYGLDK